MSTTSDTTTGFTNSQTEERDGIGISSGADNNFNSVVTSSSTINRTSNRRRCWDEAFAGGPETQNEDAEDCEEDQQFEEHGQVSIDNPGVHGKTSAEINEAHGAASRTQQHICEAHPGCLKSFSTVKELESHYNLRHKHKCATCKKSFPSAHILELHVLESHDTLFSLLAERKQMISCFLETCPMLFWNSEERKHHCLSEHSFSEAFKLWNLTTPQPPSNSTFKTNSNGTKNERRNQASGKVKGTQKVVSVKTPSVTKVSSSTSDAMVMDFEAGASDTKSSKSKVLAKNNHTQAVGAPKHITFGHAASRAFKPQSAFGMAKTKPALESNVPNEQMNIDLSEMKTVLPDMNG